MAKSSTATGHVTNIINQAEGRRPDLDRELCSLSDAARSVLEMRSPAARKAVLLLLSHTCGLKQKHVKKMLVAARELNRKYVR